MGLAHKRGLVALCQPGLGSLHSSQTRAASIALHWSDFKFLIDLRSPASPPRPPDQRSVLSSSFLSSLSVLYILFFGSLSPPSASPLLTGVCTTEVQQKPKTRRIWSEMDVFRRLSKPHISALNSQCMKNQNATTSDKSSTTRDMFWSNKWKTGIWKLHNLSHSSLKTPFKLGTTCQISTGLSYLLIFFPFVKKQKISIRISQTFLSFRTVSSWSEGSGA